jgi:hypothetical protein
MSLKTRRLSYVGPDDQVYTRVTHLDYTHVVVYHDGRRATWHQGLARAEKLARHPGDVILPVREGACA